MMATQMQLETTLQGLNEAQRQAVTCPADILQVLAPRKDLSTLSR